MSRSIVTVQEAIKEYTLGMFPSPAVKWLEAKYGTGWRGSTESKFYNRRSPLFYAYEKIVAQKKHSEGSAVERLEILRASAGGTLRMLCDKIRKPAKACEESDLLVYLEKTLK
jgi:hypothetical protein